MALDSQESNEEIPYQKQQRKKKARCWPYLDIVKEKNQECEICKLCKTKKRMKKGDSGCTTTFNRHVYNCLHGRTNQVVLQFQPSGTKSSEVTVSNFTCDHAAMRKMISHYILANELPFRHVESFMFNLVMRTATPYWQKISMQMVKKDCIITFEIESNKLKERLILQLICGLRRLKNLGIWL